MLCPLQAAEAQAPVALLYWAQLDCPSSTEQQLDLNCLLHHSMDCRCSLHPSQP